MSEGINFSDELGRCIIMVGLPFPNKNDPLLQEKLKYLKQMKTTTSNDAGNDFSSEYYENMCMKAVNQSIGRSIRHQNDYSVIILLDGLFWMICFYKKFLSFFIYYRKIPNAENLFENSALDTRNHENGE